MFELKKSYTEEELNKRIDQIITKRMDSLDLTKALRLILNCIDLTTLEGSDNKARIQSLCEMAVSFSEKAEGVPNVAAVCVYPPFVKQAKEILSETNLNVASVAGAFPSGQSPLSVKIAEIKYAVEQGADEIDMVISRGSFLEGDYTTVYNEIKSIKEACGNAHLKVILETGELGSFNNIRLASDIAIQAGADFIKTSTGKIPIAATEQAFIVMLDAIKDHFEKTGVMIGIKPAGGISDPDTALRYYMLLEEILGEKWMNNQWFRIGASRLANKVLDRLI